MFFSGSSISRIRFLVFSGIIVLVVAASGLAAEVKKGVAPQQPVAAATSSDDATLIFLRDGDITAVPRTLQSLKPLSVRYTTGLASKYEAICQGVVAGPTDEEKAQGITSALPEGTLLDHIVVPSDEAIEIYLDLPPGIVGTKAYSPRLVERTADQFQKSLLNEPIRSFKFYVKDPATSEFKPIRAFLPQPKPPVPEPDNALTDGTPQVVSKLTAPPASVGPVTGALSGKSIVLNQSHGWFDDHDGTGVYGWRVQRGKLWEMNEDWASAEFINMEVIPLLMNAGAKVYPERESDEQTHMVIVDNSSASPAYVETGSFLTSSAVGYAPYASWPANNATYNPFGNASATRYASGVIGTATASATYTPTVPAAGYYNVYVSFSMGSNRTTGAHWQVYHTGGVTDFRVNEQKDGATWLLLGNFYFNAGANADGKVVVLNDVTDTAGSIVSCDAVRLGGGMGDVIRHNHGVSGKARWQEEACVNFSFLGGAASWGPLYGDDTVNYDDEQLGWSNRPQYASCVQTRNGEGANLIYMGWHTNASTGGCTNGADDPAKGTARGLSSERDADGEASAATISLVTTVHSALLTGIRAFYDSGFANRGTTASNGYGESNQSNLGTVAGFFFETLFHDNTYDTQAYRDPKFRRIMARAVVQGMITYFGGSTFPPEPPTNFRVKNIGGNQVKLDWVAGPVRTGSLPYGSPATGYKVYVSSNGYGFDNGTAVTGATYTTTLTPGQVYFYRVAATNAGGVSIPTETLAVRVTSASTGAALIVNGYHRYDRYLAPLVAAVGGCADSNVRNIDYRRFNSFNYVIQHGLALSAAAISFDSCSADCIEAGQVTLTPYRMVDWIGGQEAETMTEPTTGATDDSALKAASKTAVQNYLQAGGKLFMSNSELAYDLGASDTFLLNYMKSTYVNDDAGTYQAQGAAGGIFAGVSTFNFDNGTGTTYNVGFPDVLGVNGGSTVCMSYVGGTGGTAAVQYSGNFGTSTTPGKLVYMGFGFETIMNASTRTTVMQNVVNYFGVSGVNRWELY